MRSVLRAVMAIGLLGLVACGGGDEDAEERPRDPAPTAPSTSTEPEVVSRAEFIAASEQVCAEFYDVAGRLAGSMFAGGRDVDIEFARQVGQSYIAGVRLMLDRLDALVPPPEDAEVVADMNRQTREVLERLLRDGEAAVVANDGRAFARAFQQADMELQPVDEARRGYGFEGCVAHRVEQGISYDLTPTEGAIGTVVTVRSTTPCPAPGPGSAAAGTQVRVALWATGARGGGIAAFTLLDTVSPTAPDGSWEVSFTVPDDALPGAHAISVACEELVPDCQPACPYGPDFADRVFAVADT